MTVQRFTATVKMNPDHWVVTVSNVGHKRQTVGGRGTTRDAAVRDAKVEVARLLNVKTSDVTLDLHDDR